MTRFRPCIDLHDGKVKQIVGGTLSEHGQELQTNFISPHSPSWFAEKYRQDKLEGGHVIKLGKGNDSAAAEALKAWKGGLQLGGGIDIQNAASWLEMGASHVIVTSCLFNQKGQFMESVLDALVREIGKDKIVLDLSCRRVGDEWIIAMNRWQTLTDLHISISSLDFLSQSCAEFLIHAADVEGLCSGIDEELVTLLGKWCKIPMTYAGGISCLEDFDLIDRLSEGNMDATVGSALDLFGGSQIQYAELIKQRG